MLNFLYLLRYRVIQYLIGELLEVVNLGLKGLVTATLLSSVRMSRKEPIYYISRTLLILKLTTVFVSRTWSYYVWAMGRGPSEYLGQTIVGVRYGTI